MRRCVSAHLRKVPDDLDQPKTNYENEAEENYQRRQTMHVLPSAQMPHTAHKEPLDANSVSWPGEHWQDSAAKRSSVHMHKPTNASEEIEKPLFMIALLSNGQITYSHTRGKCAIARWYECMWREREFCIGRDLGSSIRPFHAYIFHRSLVLTIASAQYYPQSFS